MLHIDVGNCFVVAVHREDVIWEGSIPAYMMMFKVMENLELKEVITTNANARGPLITSCLHRHKSLLESSKQEQYFQRIWDFVQVTTRESVMSPCIKRKREESIQRSRGPLILKWTSTNSKASTKTNIILRRLVQQPPASYMSCNRLNMALIRSKSIRFWLMGRGYKYRGCSKNLSTVWWKVEGKPNVSYLILETHENVSDVMMSDQLLLAFMLDKVFDVLLCGSQHSIWEGIRDWCRNMIRTFHGRDAVPFISAFTIVFPPWYCPDGDVTLEHGFAILFKQIL